MKNQQSNKDILIDFIEKIWNSGRFEEAGKYLADSYTIFHDPGDPWDGQELDLQAFQDRVKRSRTPFPDQKFEINDLISQENKVVMAWNWKATHLGDIPGFPASGKEVLMSGVTVYYFNENQSIYGHWQVADRLGVYQQLQRNN